MTDANETVADITAEMRRHIAVKMSDAWYTQEEWRKLCDRIDAAHKREMETNNNAKLREAVVKSLGIVEHLQIWYVLRGYVADKVSELKVILQAAISAPPRNCDEGGAK